MTDPHFVHSTLREVILEHILTGALLRRLWQRGIFDAEILHSEFDRGGYDLVLTRGKVTRHIQLKASRLGGRARFQKIAVALAARPAGCVVWMVVTDDLDIDHYLWLGGGPDEPLPLGDERVARHTKATAEGVKLPRPGLRVLPAARFTRIDTLDALLERLLGPAATPREPDLHGD